MIIWLIDYLAVHSAYGSILQGRAYAEAWATGDRQALLISLASIDCRVGASLAVMAGMQSREIKLALHT